MHIIFVFVLFVSSWGQSADDKADFFIVEKPGSLVIYNKYQQEITFQEQSLFVPFAPMKIIKRSDFLSDNFTACMTIQMQDETYYLIKNERKKLVNIGKAGYYRTLKNCRILSDTVQVIANGSVFISKRPGFESSSHARKYYLKNGDKVVRLFSNNGFDYVMKVSREIDYGWSFFEKENKNKTWKIVKYVQITDNAIPFEIRESIHVKIAEANELLFSLFTFFNLKTGEEKEIPQWNIEISENRIVCMFTDKQYLDHFSENIKYLINDLENIALGSNFAVHYQQGTIEIKRKESLN